MQFKEKSKLLSVIKKFSHSIHPLTIKLLNSMLSVISFYFIWLCFSFYYDSVKYYDFALIIYFPIVEHLMMSLLIAIAGGILFDISIKEIGKK